MSDHPPSEPDQYTLAQFRAGDITGLSTIFKLYGPRVYRLAGKILGNQADAEDATQEVFIRAFEQAHGFQGRSSLFTWLYRLAVRHCLNKIKQRKRAESRELATLAPPQGASEDEAGSPLENLSDQEESEVLRQVLQLLPAPYRACLVLREIEELTYAQIAGLLEIPVGTVMSRLARARRVLRANFQRARETRLPFGNSARVPVVQSVEERARDDLC
ncbi:MAG: RNA polymerase sigma factor [Planctomycetota bacterium]